MTSPRWAMAEAILDSAAGEWLIKPEALAAADAALALLSSHGVDLVGVEPPSLCQHSDDCDCSPDRCGCPVVKPTPSMIERSFRPWTMHAADCRHAD